jgi:probable HAF family extracellular repeat protein
VKNVATISVSDTAANVQYNLTSLGDVAKAKKLSAVTLTSPAPSLMIDRTAVTGDLSSLTTTNGTIQLLQRITNGFTLQVNNVSSQDALTLKTPNKLAKLSIGVKDTTANVLANLEKLQPLASTKTIASITTSDSSAPIFKISSARMAATSAAIKAIQGNYQLHVTNAKVAEVAKIGALTNVVSIEVVDTHNNIIAGIKSNLPETTVEKVNSAIVTDPLSISNAYKLLETVNFDNYDNVLKYTIADTASNVIARQRYDLGNVMKWATKVTITNKTAPTLSVADARTFTTITKLDPAIKFSISDGGKAIADQAAIAGDKVLSSASSISINKSFSIAEAKRVIALGNLDKSTKYSITDTVANILAASPTDKAVLGATAVNVVDSSQNIVNSLDELQVLAKSHRIATLQITDSSTKRLFISTDQLSKNSDVLGKLISSLIFTPSFTETSTTGVKMRILGSLATLGGPFIQESNLTSVEPLRDGAISRDGSIVVGGSLNANNKFRAYSLRNGTLEDLGSLSSINDYSVVKGISADNSTIVGYSKTGFNFDHAVMWKNGQIYDLGTLTGGRFSQAYAASADGSVIVGFSESSNTDGRRHAVIWKNGIIHDLGVQNGVNSVAAAVSDDGSVVVGTSVGTIYSAFVWKNGLTTTIPGFANEGGVGLVVSPDGSMVFGHSNITTGGSSQSFAFKNGSLTNIGGQAGSWNAPVASSFDGQVVAHYNRAASPYHAFVTKNGTTFDLGTLSGYSSFRPLSLSDDGAIVTGAISNEANEALIVQWRVPN